MNKVKYKMYVFMGYPGSGKSTIAEAFAQDRAAIYLSSDKTREKLFGFRDQTHNDQVFKYMKDTALEWADSGDCVFDATNLTRKDRIKIINDYKKYYELHLFCILRPIDEIIEVNNQRKQFLPQQYIDDSVLKRILGKFQLPTKEEGWETISFKLVTRNREDIDHDNPHHGETVKQHIDYIVSYCEQHRVMQWLYKLGYYHDLGKFFVGLYNADKGYTQFIGHAAVSAYIYLVDTIIDYISYYAKQRNTNPDEDISVYGRYINLYNFSNLSDILNMYYLIYYHDQPYCCVDKTALLSSLNKHNKPLKYWQDNKKINIEMLADILLGFNKIDRMRKEV